MSTPNNTYLKEIRRGWENVLGELQNAIRFRDRDDMKRAHEAIMDSVEDNSLPLGYPLRDDDQSYPLVEIIKMGGSPELVQAIVEHMKSQHFHILKIAVGAVKQTNFDSVYKNKILAILEKNIKQKNVNDLWEVEMAKLLSTQDKDSRSTAIQEKIQTGKLSLDGAIRGGYPLLSKIIYMGGNAELVGFLIKNKGVAIDDDALKAVHHRLKQGKYGAEDQKIFDLIVNSGSKILESEPVFQATAGAPNEMAKIYGKDLRDAFILHMTPLGRAKVANPAAVQFTVTSYDREGRVDTQDYFLENGRVKKVNGRPGDNEWPSLQSFIDVELVRKGFLPVVPREKVPEVLLQKYLENVVPKERPNQLHFRLSPGDYLALRKEYQALIPGEVKRREESLLFPTREPTKGGEKPKGP